tara:strand:+ start:237 stop:1256 length:1020 start_codon:yes stop_codon:yes gene_type:complete
MTESRQKLMNWYKSLPTEFNIFLVLLGMALLFEILGWIFIGQSFILNKRRLIIMILQVSVIGIIAVGVTQVIVMSGIDLSGGSLVAFSAIVAASLAQNSAYSKAVFPHLTDLPFLIPVLAGIGAGLIAGFISGNLIARTGIPAFIATLGMLVSARGAAAWYNNGKPVSFLTDDFTSLGQGAWPVFIFLTVALVFHILMRYTKYGKHTYAIGSNEEAARVAGINIKRHKILVYSIAGALSGLAGVVTAARAMSAQAGMGMMYELDAISAAVIGGTSLFGGRGRITGTLIGVLILGVITSGFVFLRINAYYQDMVKGAIIVGAVVLDQYRNNKLKNKDKDI